ncbi:hypothetical protein [Ornithinicoccus hortensis]|uniref:Uncharacterized protein n=1 Tax=Ornithinicoccus hortensis TaxID=82346 RepID=A0A542YM87_9MICO|nr:hypothetical protein [Ornithinicoccus hortensis]TQL49198.1 hypothetical protein FB467_0263 [Ornithinicoccus hortensis]
MEPALDPIWMGPIMIGFVGVWAGISMMILKDRTIDGQPAETPARNQPGAHRSREKQPAGR